MSREVRRVPIDFDWPLHKVWDGFLNPHYANMVKCCSCKESGLSRYAKWLQDRWYGFRQFSPEETGSTPFAYDHPKIWDQAERNVVRNWEGIYDNLSAEVKWRIAVEAKRLADHYNGQWMHHLDQDDIASLLETDRLRDFMSLPRTEEQKSLVTPREVNEWSLGNIMAYDSIACYVVIREKAKRDGQPYECPACGGHGYTWDAPESEKKYEEWVKQDPPTGDAWQMWETCSEGSPISPPCDSPESLARWLADNRASSFGSHTATYESWLAMIGEGWAPSAALISGKFMSGVEAVSKT